MKRKLENPESEHESPNKKRKVQETQTLRLKWLNMTKEERKKFDLLCIFCNVEIDQGNPPPKYISTFPCVSVCYNCIKCEECDEDDPSKIYQWLGDGYIFDCGYETNEPLYLYSCDLSNKIKNPKRCHHEWLLCKSCMSKYHPCDLCHKNVAVTDCSIPFLIYSDEKDDQTLHCCVECADKIGRVAKDNMSKIDTLYNEMYENSL